MADVVVVYPRTGLDRRGVSITLPLSVLSATSGLIGEFSVKVIDQRVTDNWKEVLKKELKSKPFCVALSSMTGTQIFYALEISRLVKENYSDIPVVWGGMHVTLMAEQSLKHPDIDFIIKGEGELAFRNLVREFADSRHFELVAGLGWKKQDGTLQINPEGPPLDINNLPPIPYDLLDIENYTTPGQYLYPGASRLLPVQGSRGCPFKCTFCSEPALTRTYRMMTPGRLYEQTSELVQRYSLDHIVFYDDEFFANTRWATSIARFINGQYSWTVQGRADDMLKVDLKEMERCGMLVVQPGLESGSNRILKWIKKQETAEQSIAANRKLAETSIFAQYNFMMGFPGETQEELNETVDLALRLMEENPRAIVNQFSPFTPLPGTELLDISVNEFGFKLPETLEGWIGVARRRLPTSWQQEKKKLFEYLMYTSIFISSSNNRFLSKAYWWLPSFIYAIYGCYVKRRWRKRDYRHTPEIKLMRWKHKQISPIDFVDKFEN